MEVPIEVVIIGRQQIEIHALHAELETLKAQLSQVTKETVHEAHPTSAD